MEKIKQFLKTKNGLIVGGVILIIIGFFGGMEYKAYQVRTALNDIGKNIQKALGGDTKEIEPSKQSADLKNKVSLVLTDKGFYNGDYQDQLTFKFQFTNNTSKDIQGVQGRISFVDIFGNSFYKSTINYDKGIPANSNKVYTAAIDYNQFLDEHTKIKNTDIKNMSVGWIPEIIVYSDGTKEE
jgi:hypothetical protein